MTILVVLVIALVVALARGGRISHLADLRFHWVYLLTVPLLIQIVLYTPLSDRFGLDLRNGPGLYLFSMGLGAFVIWANRDLPGFRWLFVGLVSNLIVILANNGYMPVWMTARELAGLESFSGVHNNVIEMTRNSPFWFLGDLLPIPRPIPFANVLSLGDVCISLGAVVFIQRALVPNPRKSPANADAQDLVLKT